MTFIKSQLIKDVAKKLDEKIKLKGIAEFIDGPFFRLSLNLLNDKFGDKVPQKYQDEIILLLESFVSDDYSRVTEATINTLNEVIDIPGMNEEYEGILISGLVDIIKRMILKNREAT